MANGFELMLGMLGIFVGLVAFVVYRWRQRRRVGQVKVWLQDFLATRYRELPDPPNINCSEDRLWPILVTMDRPRSGTRHHMQFMCPGARSALALISDKVERLAAAG